MLFREWKNGKPTPLRCIAISKKLGALEVCTVFVCWLAGWLVS